ncbi:MAG: hypothetical protein ACRDPF_34600, partial [Streptosporangiaceae bacterium]
LTAAVVALAASWVGVTLSVAAEMAVLTLIVAAAITVERRAAPSGGSGGVVPPGEHRTVDA